MVKRPGLENLGLHFVTRGFKSHLHRQNMRLNKFISQSGIASRRKADILIEEGKIKLNKRTAKLGDVVDPDVDEVVYQGKKIGIKDEYEYYLLNKPIGVVSTTSDEKGRRSVVALINSESKLYPVGRLDKDSTGLIILTNDGEFAQKISHPSYNLQKTYLVTTRERIEPRQIEKLGKGVKLNDGWTKNADVERLGSRNFEISITEGRNRQVRRMAAAVGLTVVDLKRIKIGSLSLGNTRLGNYRKLTKEEIDSLTH